MLPLPSLDQYVPAKLMACSRRSLSRFEFWLNLGSLLFFFISQFPKDSASLHCRLFLAGRCCDRRLDATGCFDVSYMLVAVTLRSSCQRPKGWNSCRILRLSWRITMSTTSKVTLGVSAVATTAIIAYVHLSQRWDLEVFVLICCCHWWKQILSPNCFKG